MVLFLILLSSAIALIVIGAVVDVLYLLSTGVLLLVVAVMYLLARSILRSRRGRPTAF
ncbi:hypothetical protein AB0D98_04490 [Streptomyces sp. NPDC047987]|uniref:hypothetical protein n=1 Tax=unclassified Streptomyces TaxID=2593676 RepID=UPI00342BE480